jgi:anti-sigma factor RsiW
MPPNRSECEEVVRRLWPHLDGVLPEDDRERVVRHLEMCTACRSHFDFAQAFLEAVEHARPQLDEFTRVRGRVVAALAAEGFSAGGDTAGLI